MTNTSFYPYIYVVLLLLLLFFVVVFFFLGGGGSEQEKACASHNSRTVTKAVTYVCYQRPLQRHRHRRHKGLVSSDTDV